MKKLLAAIGVAIMMVFSINAVSHGGDGKCEKGKKECSAKCQKKCEKGKSKCCTKEQAAAAKAEGKSCCAGKSASSCSQSKTEGAAPAEGTHKCNGHNH